MPQFLVYARDDMTLSGELRDRLLDAHIEYVLKNDARIKLSGFLTDDEGRKCGSVYCFHAPDVDEVRAFFEHEPYALGRLYRSIEITRWTPVVVRYEAKEWPVQDKARPQAASP